MLRLPSRRRAVLVAGLAVLVSAASCTGSGQSPKDRPTAGASRTLAFASCDTVACAGEIDGAKYEIRLPETWNGTLLLYSHGYRAAQPAPPDYGPPRTDAAVAATAETADRLLAAGYALAGSGYARNGWAVAEGVEAGEQLYEFFRDKVGKPDRVYVWGDSLGGLITAALAEKHSDWVAGAVPMCGVLGGTNLNLDLALDVSYAVKTLLYPEMKVVGFTSYAEARKTFEQAQQRIMAATRDIPGGVAKLLVIGALVDGPRQTGRFDGSNVVSAVSAGVEALLTGLAYSTVGRHELEQRVGGNPSTNVGVDYATRISAAERQQIEALAPGAVAQASAALAAGARVPADAAARTAADALGNPTGELKDPTLTVHTAADPLVIVQNETVFAGRVAEAGRQADLRQVYTVAPKTFQAPAPYGAGHCNFTTGERVGAIDVLDRWVRTGRAPSPTDIDRAFGPDSGYDPLYQPGPWPAAAR